MATGADVLTMLLPAGGWIITADDFDSVIWVDDRPRCTEAEFKAGFAQYDAWKEAQSLAAIETKNAALAKLAALGLDLDDLKSLGF